MWTRVCDSCDRMFDDSSVLAFGDQCPACVCGTIVERRMAIACPRCGERYYLTGMLSQCVACRAVWCPNCLDKDDPHRVDCTLDELEISSNAKRPVPEKPKRARAFYDL